MRNVPWVLLFTGVAFAQAPVTRPAGERLEALSSPPTSEPPAGFAALTAQHEGLWGGAYLDPREQGTLPNGDAHEWAFPEPHDLAATVDFVRSRLLGRPIAVGEVEEWVRYDLEGRRHSLSELLTGPDGQHVAVLALHWFAEWCDNCNAEATYLDELDARYSARGLRIVGLAEYSHPQKIREFIQRYKIPFLVLQGTPNAKDEDIRFITDHYRYRKSLGDTRKWGTPMTLFLEHGDTRHVTAVLGEMRPIPTEAFLQAALGAAPETGASLRR